jgi:hypothetical protein
VTEALFPPLAGGFNNASGPNLTNLTHVVSTLIAPLHRHAVARSSTPEFDGMFSLRGADLISTGIRNGVG